jgi:hypothetical protein
MPEGGAVRISTEGPLVRTPGDGEPMVRFSVEDKGAGMEPCVLERIFEPFFTTKQPSEGTGLGLSVVMGFVEECGGSIEVHSEPGEGSRFDLYLPVAGPPRVELEAARDGWRREDPMGAVGEVTAAPATARTTSPSPSAGELCTRVRLRLEPRGA